MTTTNSPLFLLMGSHLFTTRHLPISKKTPIVMIEDFTLCTYYKYHKHKLILFLESMRNYKDLLIKEGFKIDYYELNSKNKNNIFLNNLKTALCKHNANSLHTYEIEDHFFYLELKQFCQSQKLSWTEHSNPLFLNTRDEVKMKISSRKTPFMRHYYENERRLRNILMDNDKPIGGKYSYDDMNRKRLPKGLKAPFVPKIESSPNHQAVCQIVNELFLSHPGDTSNFWLPTTHKQAQNWLNDFIKNRFNLFGHYEDALSDEQPFIFHSVLSPLLNCGLLTPQEVIRAALETKDIPLNSREGFLRQILGWREFIRGIDLLYVDKKMDLNVFCHSNKLSSSWYKASTGLRILDKCIEKVNIYGYCHHIERLMIISNIMLLCEIDPKEAYRWFMELFVDSADWVMGPNVYGMGQFSDGGFFATKPYICGANYLKKMGAIVTKDEELTLNGLYWRFIHKNRDFFSKQPRLNMMTRSLDKMSIEKQERLFSAAEAFIKKNTK